MVSVKGVNEAAESRASAVSLPFLIQPTGRAEIVSGGGHPARRARHLAWRSFSEDKDRAGETPAPAGETPTLPGNAIQQPLRLHFLMTHCTGTGNLQGDASATVESAMNETAPLRIAMWSGPRNISTALMRSWGNREDTAVVDEPFYACYLRESQVDHPGAEEVIAAGETNWRKVAKQLTSRIPLNKRIYYQKQMTHHLLPEIERGWVGQVTNCFLIRDPREVIASYMQKNHDPKLADLGFEQQEELFDFVHARTGRVPPVIDARDVLENPERTLRLLCDAVGVEFSDRMLAWPPGPRATDGIWAKHWYAEVERSTSFRPYEKKEALLPERMRSICDECVEIYLRLREHRLR